MPVLQVPSRHLSIEEGTLYKRAKPLTMQSPCKPCKSMGSHLQNCASSGTGHYG